MKKYPTKVEELSKILKTPKDFENLAKQANLEVASETKTLSEVLKTLKYETAEKIELVDGNYLYYGKESGYCYAVGKSGSISAYNLGEESKELVKRYSERGATAIRSDLIYDLLKMPALKKLQEEWGIKPFTTQNSFSPESDSIFGTNSMIPTRESEGFLIRCYLKSVGKKIIDKKGEPFVMGSWTEAWFDKLTPYLKAIEKDIANEFEKDTAFKGNKITVKTTPQPDWKIYPIKTGNKDNQLLSLGFQLTFDKLTKFSIK
jgi:hypothetical protein